MKAGFDPKKVSDPLYYADPATGAFTPIDADVFAGIHEGTVRL